MRLLFPESYDGSSDINGLDIINDPAGLQTFFLTVDTPFRDAMLQIDPTGRDFLAYWKHDKSKFKHISLLDGGHDLAKLRISQFTGRWATNMVSSLL